MTEQDGTTKDRRFTGRQVTIMVVAVCLAITATPFAALAAAASFSSNSSSTPAVSAKNTSSGSGAKAIYGNASATGGATYGVYGHSGSASGYGVYSAGRLGSSGALVCSHCVTGPDINAATFPTVPNASELGSHAPSYYAHITPLSWLGTQTGDHLAVDVDGLGLYVNCFLISNVPHQGLSVAADSSAGDGTLNWFSVSGSAASSGGAPLGTGEQLVAASIGGTQTEGTAIYRNNTTGSVVTIDFHLYADNCELFGDVLTAA